MVQRLIQQGDFSFPRESNGWPRNERSYLDTSQENRLTNANTSVHPRCLTIEAALRECVRIPLKEFGLVVTLENGETRTYSSSSLAPYRQRFFNDQFHSNFRRAIRKATGDTYSSSGYGQDGMYGEIDMDSGYDRKSSGSSESRRHRKTRSDDSDRDGSSSTRKKRARIPGLYRENSNDDASMPVPVQKTQQLMIGDEVEVEKFYACRFKDMQQSSCKVMGKAFVKLVEPKKQTHHPYTKGDDKAPPWWPQTTGDENIRVRHKEPDHLLKPERIRLLVHILRMIVEPHEKQCATVQKLGLNVKKLEDVTMEAMSNWFNDKDHPENASKRPFLKEIFKIAKAEERYKNGEIDGTTVIPVMYGERSGAGDISDDENEEQFKDEDDEHDMPPNINTPESLASPRIGHTRHLHPEPDSNSFGIRPLPVRHNTQPQPMEDHYSDPSSFFSRGLNVNFQPRSPNLQDRQFVSPQSGFHSPPMYWPPNMVSNASTSNSFYASSPQTSLPPSSGPYNPLPLPNAQQTMLPPPINTQHGFDGLSVGRTYDSGPALGSQLRTGSLGHPHQILQHHGFQDYLQESGSFGHHEDLKEQHHIHQS